MKSNLILLFKTLLILVNIIYSEPMTCLEFTEHLKKLSDGFSQVFVIKYPYYGKAIYARNNYDFYVYFSDLISIVKVNECLQYSTGSLIVLSNINNPEKLYKFELNQGLDPLEYEYKNNLSYIFRFRKLGPDDDEFFESNNKESLNTDSEKLKEYIQSLKLKSDRQILNEYIQSLRLKFNLNWINVSDDSIKKSNFLMEYNPHDYRHIHLEYISQITDKKGGKDEGKNEAQDTEGETSDSSEESHEPKHGKLSEAEKYKLELIESLRKGTKRKKESQDTDEETSDSSEESPKPIHGKLSEAQKYKLELIESLRE